MLYMWDVGESIGKRNNNCKVAIYGTLKLIYFSLKDLGIKNIDYKQ